MEPTQLLGGLTPEQFLAEYWQKKPLLVRQAIPGFTGVIDRERVFELASDEDVESRLVEFLDGEYACARGPFSVAALKRKRKSLWTVLVQGINLVEPAGDELMRRFDFIPQARLDDLMVSWAVPGAGVGPHFDAYDVFLIQGSGKRLWQISTQDDHEFIPDAPLRLLKHFAPTQEWVMEPGDMLYLPPQCAHNGIAQEENLTFSVGFRTPLAQELGSAFLGYLQDGLMFEGVYADPNLAIQTHPAEIGDEMVEQVARFLESIRWTRDDVNAFLGEYLTEPKVHVFFDPPEKPISRTQFKRGVATRGLILDPRTQMLFRHQRLFVNGEVYALPPDAEGEYIVSLADNRSVGASVNVGESALDMLYDWYCAGYLDPRNPVS